MRLLSFLKGSANGFGACGSAAGTYGDLISGAVGVTVVVNAILYVAAYTLDMLLGSTLISALALFFFHHFFNPPFR